VAFGTKALAESVANFAGSYWISSFTNETRFVPGSTDMSRGIGSPIFFWIGALADEGGEIPDW